MPVTGVWSQRNPARGSPSHYFEKSVLPGILSSLSSRRFWALRALRMARLASLCGPLLNALMESSDAFSIAWWAGRAGVLEELNPWVIGSALTLLDASVRQVPGGVCDGGQLCWGIESAAELAQVMVGVQVTPAHPLGRGHRAEHGMWRPGASGAGELLQLEEQDAAVDGEIARRSAPDLLIHDGRGGHALGPLAGKVEGQPPVDRDGDGWAFDRRRDSFA